jgi:hypothetical protein
MSNVMIDLAAVMLSGARTVMSIARLALKRPGRFRTIPAFL